MNSSFLDTLQREPVEPPEVLGASEDALHTAALPIEHPPGLGGLRQHTALKFPSLDNRIANSLFIEVSDLVTLIPMFPLQSGSLEDNEKNRAWGSEAQSRLKARMDDQLATGLSVDEVLKEWMPGRKQ